MNLLLDTHIAIWALNDDPQLSPRARDFILDPDNTIYISVISVWEIMLKHAKHPKMIPFSEKDFSKACTEAGYNVLNLSEKHIHTVSTLPAPEESNGHNDPFDRILIAQAKSENLSFVTHDKRIIGYNERYIVAV